MVSLRRRRLLGLCTGNCFTEIKFPNANGNAEKISNYEFKSVTMHSTPSNDFLDKGQPNDEPHPASSNVSDSGTSEDGQFPDYEVPKVKRRRPHKRKHSDNGEKVIFKGVYFKNQKWQAAIKVDKKQVHLGTVGSQEEAACLYDKAAFLRGRQPNFELREEDKQALRQLRWDGFLAMTRNAISEKKHRRVMTPTNSDAKNYGDQGQQEKASAGYSGSDDFDSLASRSQLHGEF